jgi:hypothetical protein
MRTRTLLILAVVCGLAILLAGSIQFFRLAGGDDEAAENLRIGQSAETGDLDVTVVDAVEQDGLMRVTVRLAGVDDPSGLNNFQLIVSGSRIEPLTAAQAGSGACETFTVAEQTCDLVFGTATSAGEARVLLLIRGEDRARWDLTAPPVD